LVALVVDAVNIISSPSHIMLLPVGEILLDNVTGFVLLNVSVTMLDILMVLVGVQVTPLTV